MRTCVICHFETELDDVMIPSPTGLCICVRCYHRETGTEAHMDKRLRKQVVQAVEDAPAG